MTSQECVDFVRNEISLSHVDELCLKKIAHELAKIAILIKRVKDNVTVMVIGLKNFNYNLS